MRRISVLRIAIALFASLSIQGASVGPAVAMGLGLGHSRHGHNGNWHVNRIPPAAHSGIEHIVVVMMENRSFDHVLGWLPNADGRQQGLSYVDDDGTVLSTAPLAPDYQGCGHPDPDHSWEGGRVEVDGGAMDGFLRAGANDAYAVGYYTEDDRPFSSALATRSSSAAGTALAFGAMDERRGAL